MGLKAYCHWSLLAMMKGSDGFFLVRRCHLIQGKVSALVASVWVILTCSVIFAGALRLLGKRRVFILLGRCSVTLLTERNVEPFLY